MSGFKNLEEKIIYHMLKGEYKIGGKDNSDNIVGSKGGVRKTEDVFSEISGYINIMQSTREMPTYREIVCYKRFIGGIIVFGKRIVRRFMKFYIEPNTIQQNEFNSAVTPAIGKLTETIFTQKAQIEEMNSRLLNLIEENELRKEENNVLRLENKDMRNTFDAAYNQINLNTEKLDKLNELELDIFKEKVFNLFEKKSFSQAGEDTICAYILYVTGMRFEECTYIDLGANHAKDLSNTYWFYTKGARGVLVEANTKLIPELKFYRNGDVIVNKCISDITGDFIDFYVLNGDGLSTPDLDMANSFIEKNPELEIVETISIETITVNDIIENYMGKAPVILNIDIEGKDMEIIRTIDFDKYRPFIIIAEMIEYEKNIVVENKNDEITDFLKSKNYTEYAFTGINSIFVDKERLKGGE